jgi:L-asparaginase
VYFDALSAFQVGEPTVLRLLHTAQATLPFQVIELLRKDSLELTEEDRERLCQQVASLRVSRVIVTHGTDTMTESAKALTRVSGKTIVLTGALAPARFQESDAPFNLGMAFAAVQVVPPGVYIAMSGQVFRAGQVRKDRENGRFVRLDET